MKKLLLILTILLFANSIFALLSNPSNIASISTGPHYSFILNWVNSDPTVTGFILYRSNDNTNFNQIVNISDASVTNFVDSGLLGKNHFYYYIIAYNIYGNSPNSSVVVGITP